MTAELAGVASGTAKKHTRLGEARPGRTEVLQHAVEKLAGSCQGDDMSARSDRHSVPAPARGIRRRSGVPACAARQGPDPDDGASAPETCRSGGYRDRHIRFRRCRPTGSSAQTARRALPLAKKRAPGRPADLGEPPLPVDMFQAVRRSSSAERQIHVSGKGGKRCFQGLAAVHDRPKAAHVDDRPA